MEHEWTHRSGYSAGLVYLKMILFHSDKCISIVVSLISICLALCLSHTNIDGCNRFHPGLTLWITNQQYLMDSTNNIDQYWGQFQHVAALLGVLLKLLWVLVRDGTSTWMTC